MSTFSLYPRVGSDFMNSTNIMSGLGDNWKSLAQHYLFDDNSTAMDIFYYTLFGDSYTSGIATDAVVAPAIWNHAMTKTVGWTIFMLLKTVVFERKFDRWSGMHRFLNVGSTLVPFAMAAWTIYNATSEEGGGKEDEASTTSTTMILWKYFVNTPMVRNWVLTGLASVLFHHLVVGRIRSSKAFTAIAWIPGILAGILSLACWIDETAVAAILLGGQEESNTIVLLRHATLMRWAANTIAGWYCYAWILKGVFGTKRFTSFPCFLLAVFAGRIATSGRVF